MKNSEKYTLIETSRRDGELNTNLLGVFDSRKVAVDKLNLYRSTLKRLVILKLNISEEEFLDDVHTDYDTCFEYCDQNGYFQYNLLVRQSLSQEESIANIKAII